MAEAAVSVAPAVPRIRALSPARVAMFAARLVHTSRVLNYDYASWSVVEPVNCFSINTSDLPARARR